MASSRFPLLLLLLLLLSARGRAFVAAHRAHVHELVHAQPGVRLPRGLLDGLVGAVLSPVVGAGGDDCSSARGDSLNIGATLPLGIAAGISGSSASARSKDGCGAGAESSSAGVNSGSGSAASAGGSGYGAGGSGTAHGSEVFGQGHHHGSFSSGGKALPSGSAVNGVGWESQSGSHAVSGSAGQTTTDIVSKAPGNGNGFSSSGGYVGGAPVRGEVASVSETSSQSASVSKGQGGSVTGEYGHGSLGDESSAYGGGHVHRSNGDGVGSSKAGSRGQEIRGNGLNQDESSGVNGGIVSSSSSTSRASSSAGSFVGAPPGTSHSSSRSDANSSSQSNSFVIRT